MISLAVSPPAPIATVDATLLQALRSLLFGQVSMPGEEGYDAARATFNSDVQQRPSVIVAAAAVSDVIAAVGFARLHHLPIRPEHPAVARLGRPLIAVAETVAHPCSRA